MDENLERVLESEPRFFFPTVLLNTEVRDTAVLLKLSSFETSQEFAHSHHDRAEIEKKGTDFAKRMKKGLRRKSQTV